MSLAFLIAPPRIPRPVGALVVIDGKPVRRKKVSKKTRTPEQNRAYYLKNRARILAASRKWEKTPAGKAAKRRTYLRGKEKIKARSRAWYEKNAEQVKERAREYYRKNRDKILAKGIERRAKTKLEKTL